MSKHTPEIEAIMLELQDHNEQIGAGEREPDRLLQDAKFVDMVRNQGIRVETLSMMCTDFMFGCRAHAAMLEALESIEFNERIPLEVWQMVKSAIALAKGESRG